MFHLFHLEEVSGYGNIKLIKGAWFDPIEFYQRLKNYCDFAILVP